LDINTQSRVERIEVLALLVRVEGPTTASQRTALEKISKLAQSIREESEALRLVNQASGGIPVASSGHY